ncbi:hypothetical protein MSC49_27930 [Methylosinus sp. C49]|uniref:hypothetical protein n=1 Tax=Methylosinus sp. C49 TaxID=2699395 RepID=UPI00136758EB|nr:hypothetical protein [Methylosinus sp. C49]BBU62858.1 hypothetical protein MSC49_27930 [Methylosinus sp. C49]
MNKKNDPPINFDPKQERAQRRPLPSPSESDVAKPVTSEPLADKLRHVRAILRAVEESREQNLTTKRLFEPTAIDCLKQLVEALDRNEGVEAALVDARTILKTAGMG